MQKDNLLKARKWAYFSLMIIIALVFSSSAYSIERTLNNNDATIAIDIYGYVFTWGSNEYGQLGIGNTADKNTPQYVSGIANIIDVAAGRFSSYALDSDGNVWSWGRNDTGQLGIGNTTAKLTPQPVTALSNIVDIESFGWHALALDDEGYVWTWGRNDWGQLGLNNTTDKTSPVLIPTLSHVKAIAVGGWHSAVLLSDGSVYAWGYNAHGQAGNGSTNIRKKTPVQVIDSSDNALLNVKALFASSEHTFAVKSDGTVWSWGLNDYRQLGVGTLNSYNKATEVIALYNSTAIFPGARHSMAKLYNGTVMVWGSNEYGELGEGYSDSSHEHAEPVPVDITNVDKIYQSCQANFIKKTDGTFWGWGRNDYGQVGVGNFTSPQAPVQIDFDRLSY
jgi:alpha-tubulin suppressor-like RCC1 family protein